MCQEKLIEFRQDKETGSDPGEACLDRPFFLSPRSHCEALGRQRRDHGIRCCCFVCESPAAVYKGEVHKQGLSLPCVQCEWRELVLMCLRFVSARLFVLKSDFAFVALEFCLEL